MNLDQTFTQQTAKLAEQKFKSKTEKSPILQTTISSMGSGIFSLRLNVGLTHRWTA